MKTYLASEIKLKLKQFLVYKGLESPTFNVVFAEFFDWLEQQEQTVGEVGYTAKQLNDAVEETEQECNHYNEMLEPLDNGNLYCPRCRKSVSPKEMTFDKVIRPPKIAELNVNEDELSGKTG